MVKGLVLALFVGMAWGCSGDSTGPVAETKATEVSAPQLSPEQQAQVDAAKGDPNYDPAEAAAKQNKGK